MDRRLGKVARRLRTHARGVLGRRSEPTGPTVFQGFWHGPPLGDLRHACLRSFIRKGHEFHLFTYDPVDVPPGVVNRDANEVIPMSELFYYDNALADARDLGPFSDLFRFKLLLEQGGWYCDVDTVCLAEEIPACPRAWAREMVELDRLCVGAGQIALAAGDPLARTLYERCLARSKTTGYAREDLGPRLISSVVGESGLPVDMVGRPETFYPIRWIEIFKLWLPDFTAEVRERLDGAWFLPIYQSFPRYCGLDDPDRLPPVGSFLHQFSLECDPRLEHAECYPAADVRAATWSFFEREGDWAIAELVTVSGPETVDRLRP